MSSKALAAAIKKAQVSGNASVAVVTVYSVTAGASADGLAQVVVTFDGHQLPVPYLTDGYPAPAAGDVVQLLIVDNSPTIQGRVGGFPTY